MLATVLRKAEETIQEEFDGLGCYVTVPADQATARVMARAAATLRQGDWFTSLHFNMAVSPSMLGGRPRATLLSYLMIVAVDALSENVLRVRRETAT